MGWHGLAGGARVSEFFSQKNPNFFFLVGRGGGGGGRAGVCGRWMDSRTGPNQFAPSISSKLGA